MKSKLMANGLRGITLFLAFVLASCLETNNVNPALKLQEDIAQIDAYLAANPPAEEDVIVRDATGIRLVITQTGTGIVPPTLENIIQVAYAGRILANGRINQQTFDERNTSDPYTLQLTASVIAGWKIALRMMTEGTKARVYIPSALAYGTKGSGSIPGNSILVFDLELMVVHTRYEQPQLGKDLDSIARYVAEHEIMNVQAHPRGLQYTVQSQGTGPAPGLYDQVKIRYTGRLIKKDQEAFINNVEQGPTADFSSRPVNYPPGLGLGLQLMRAGGKTTFYVPSALGFARTASTPIPANSILIYEVELLEVIPNPQ